MNFIDGTLARTEKGWRVVAGDALLPLGPGAPGPEGRKVVFGIRPEHLGVGPVSAGVPAEVEVIEPTGASTYVFTRIAGAPVTAIFTDRRQLAPGEHIGLVAQPDRIHLFDAETGQRLSAKPSTSSRARPRNSMSSRVNLAVTGTTPSRLSSRA